MEICTVGGYEEVGKNMTAVKVGNDVVILDMGIFLPAIVNLEREERIEISYRKLRAIGALPEDSAIEDWRDKVKAIILGHVHLDHIAAVPYLASKYNAPVIGTPYTIEVLKSILRDEEIRLPNKLIALNPNSSYQVSENITAELIGITHSTLQCTLIALHTPEGIVLYCNDFKFDNHPMLGKKPNYEKLRQLGRKGVKVVIAESLYASREGKTPSEKVAYELLKDVLLGTDNAGHAVFVTTFASHIARLHSIVELGKLMNRNIVIIGRSMEKYIRAAEKLKLVNLSKDALIAGRSKQIKKVLQKVEKDPASYVVICTGNQGEPESVLTRMVNDEFPFRFRADDYVVFSSSTIPSPTNIARREEIETRLMAKGAKLFKDIHVSGHCGREDLRDLINMVKPQHIIPAHAELEKRKPLAELAREMGYKDKNVHLVKNGKLIRL